MAGIRGVPARFGGSETAVEEIGRRLAAEGDEVVVYCRRTKAIPADDRYLGMRRVVLRSIRTFHLDTVTHSGIAALHCRLTDSADVLHFHGMGNGLVLPLLWGSGKRTVVTIDGPDWERPKWGPAAKSVLRLSAWFSTHLADRIIIDNYPSLRYFEEHYRVSGHFVRYGADFARPESTALLDDLGLRPKEYNLFVGALVPDKGPDVLVRAYREVSTDMPLVIVGDSPFAGRFRQALHEAARRDSRIRFLGYRYGAAYRELVAHAYAYCHPLRSDGTSPALLQAMAYGSCIIVNSLPEALSAVGDAALSYDRDDARSLARRLQEIVDDPARADEYRRRALAYAREHYDWDAVTAAHRSIYISLRGQGEASGDPEAAARD